MKTPLRFAAIVSAFVATAVGCAPAKILNTITPSASFEREKNVSYGSLDRQKLDIYRTSNPRDEAPVIVFVHGGSWDSGSKDLYKFFAEGFTAEGFDVVVPNYRLYPEAVFPLMLEDTGKALTFAADMFGGRNLVVIGHSAGAYNLLMTLMRPEFYPGGSEAICSRISGIVSLAGPTGIAPLESEPYISIFPDRFTSTDAPINNAEEPLPPVFFGHGLKDTTVNPLNSEYLAEKINARGGLAVLKTYEGLNHIDVVKVMSKYFDGGAPVKADVINFINGLETGAGPFCR